MFGGAEPFVQFGFSTLWVHFCHGKYFEFGPVVQKEVSFKVKDEDQSQ